MAAQLGYKDVPRDTRSCASCLKLIKSKSYSELSYENKQTPLAPCYPQVFDYPHKCCYQTFLAVFEVYKLKCITDKVFQRWLDFNSLNYHTTDSDFAFSLWKDRMEAFDIPSATQLEWELAEMTWKNTHQGPHPFLRYVRCKDHQMSHIHFLPNYNFQNLNPKLVASLHTFFPPPTRADGKKINIPITKLVSQMLREGYIHQVNTVLSLFPINTPETIVVMHLINIMGVDSYLKIPPLMRADKACCMNPTQYNVYFKALGVATRRCSRWVDGSPLDQEDICKLSYLEMCLGRMTSQSDWAEEKAHRCGQTAYLKRPDDTRTPSPETNLEYLRDLREELHTIFGQLLHNEGPDMSWEDFVLQRQLWIAGGSAGGEKVVIDGESRRIDKKVLFEKLTKDEIVAWLYQEPKITAVGSEKFEITKPRAIYGADCQSYIILTYLTRSLEASLSSVEGFQDGLSDLEELDAISTRVKIVSDPDIHTTMVDYTDFNYQHTLQCQSLMFEVIESILIARDAHQDMIKAANWAKLACLNQYVHFPNEKEYHKVTQGMFSGIRTTNFMNTILNMAYFKVADKYTQNRMMVKPTNLNTIHKGDDVWITNSNLAYAIVLYASMECSKLEFRASKQLFGHEAEFLRVRYWAGSAMGYVNRSIGTLTERPMQSQESNSPAVMLHGLRSQLNVCFRRGLSADACNLLWQVVLDEWSGFKQKPLSGIFIPRSIIAKSYTLGGLDLGPPLTLGLGGTYTAPIPVEVKTYKHLSEQVAQHMTTDFAQHLSSQLQKSFNIESIKTHVHNVNVSGAASNKEHYISIKHLANDILVWKNRLKDDGKVVRSTEAFNDYINQPDFDEHTFNILEMMEQKDPRFKMLRSDNMVHDIFKAIHSSPYRDIATAQRASGANLLDAALLCVLENSNERLRMRAITALSMMSTRLCRDIVVRILQGIRSAGNNFECILHPIAISWISSTALNQAVAYAAKNNVQSTKDWDDILSRKQQLVMCAAIKQGMFGRMSKY